MKVFGTMILGDNEIRNCEQALILEGEEVFRLRERENDGQLVVDFAVRDENGQMLAKIFKNHVMHRAPHLEIRSQPGRYEVVRTETGSSVAMVEEVSPVAVRVTGTFCVKGCKVEITTAGIRISPGGNLISKNMVDGHEVATRLDRNTVVLGGRQ